MCTHSPNDIYFMKNGSRIPLSEHRDYRTICNDMDRSLYNFAKSDPDCSTSTNLMTNNVYLRRHRLLLTNIILVILQRHPHLYYYQVSVVEFNYNV